MNSPDDRLDLIAAAVTRIDVHLEGLRVALSALTESSHDHEFRIRSMERWRYQVTSLLAAAAFVLGALVSAAVDRWL